MGSPGPALHVASSSPSSSLGCRHCPGCPHEGCSWASDPVGGSWGGGQAAAEAAEVGSLASGARKCGGHRGREAWSMRVHREATPWALTGCHFSLWSFSLGCQRESQGCSELSRETSCKDIKAQKDAFSFAGLRRGSPRVGLSRGAHHFVCKITFTAPRSSEACMLGDEVAGVGSPGSRGAGLGSQPHLSSVSALAAISLLCLTGVVLQRPLVFLGDFLDFLPILPEISI